MGEQDAVGKVPAQLSEYWTEGSVAAENLIASTIYIASESNPEEYTYTWDEALDI